MPSPLTCSGTQRWTWSAVKDDAVSNHGGNQCGARQVTPYIRLLGQCAKDAGFAVFSPANVFGHTIGCAFVPKGTTRSLLLTLTDQSLAAGSQTPYLLSCRPIGSYSCTTRISFRPSPPVHSVGWLLLWLRAMCRRYDLMIPCVLSIR